LVDELGPALSAKGGVPHSAALQALARLTPMTTAEEKRIFALSGGKASVLEATAVAAGTVRAIGRRVIAVADVGAGTSDFAAFMTGVVPNVLAEVKESSRILHSAGDFLDGQLQRYILKKTGLPETAPAVRGLANRLRVRARRNKEILFSEGTLTIEHDDDDLLEVTAQEFLADEHVIGFAQRLREKFHETLEIAIACAKHWSAPRSQAPVEILLTGGGHALPMVRSLYESPSLAWTFRVGAADLAERAEDIAFHSVHRQLVVAIGGAVRDQPEIVRIVS
jgi:hypothetical protein